VDGSLYELQTGGSLSLANNPNGAANVVNEALNDITSLRGRLGAFQSTTLQTNINTLQSTLSNLTSAQSNIQDADFAVETADLTRAQILVQAGTQVLTIANQNPQNVLTLLKNA
jgi:flagellin